MRRDRTAEILSPVLSPIEADIRERLELTGLTTRAQWDAMLSRAYPALAEVARRGGDPRFVLMVLASARWRRLRSPGAKLPKWIRSLERLATDEELHRLIGPGDEPRMRLKASAEDALSFLRSFVWQDDGPFDSITTGRSAESARWTSRRAEHAIAVLAWHLQTGVSTRKGYLELVARLVEAFDLIISRRHESPPVEAVKQRVKRMKGDYYQKFLIPRYRLMFHENHSYLSQKPGNERVARCGTACFSAGV